MMYEVVWAAELGAPEIESDEFETFREALEAARHRLKDHIAFGYTEVNVKETGECVWAAIKPVGSGGIVYEVRL